MYKTTESFINSLMGNGIKYRYVERKQKSDLIILKYRMDNKRLAQVLVFFEPDEKNVAFRCYTGIKVDTEKRNRILEAINKLNPQYRGIKFYLDDLTDSDEAESESHFDSGEIVIGSELTVDVNSSEILTEVLGRFVNVIDASYAPLCRALLD